MSRFSLPSKRHSVGLNEASSLVRIVLLMKALSCGDDFDVCVCYAWAPLLPKDFFFFWYCPEFTGAQIWSRRPIVVSPLFRVDVVAEVIGRLVMIVVVVLWKALYYATGVVVDSKIRYLVKWYQSLRWISSSRLQAYVWRFLNEKNTIFFYW